MATYTVTKKVQIPIDTIRMAVAVRYDEEDMPRDFPGRKGDVWHAEIDIATGTLKNWPGPAFDLYMKVCDEGSYWLIGNGEIVASRENHYVPDCVPGEYGDYINLSVEADGKIKNWPKNGPAFDGFDPSDED